MRAQKVALAAVALAAGLSLTACGGGESTDAKGSAPKSSESGEKLAATSAKSGDGQVTTGHCKTSDLSFRTSHGMGEGDLLVSMKNTGGDACSLKGFPGVDLKADEGPGGISAERSDRTPKAVALLPGKETRFTLHTPRNDTGGSGLDITRIVVTPPNETHSRTLPVSLNLPVTDGGGKTVHVDPVGSGK